jgi:hypothetical protein
MFIQKSNSDTAVDNIHANHSDFLFHSDYRYFEYVGKMYGTVSLPGHSPVIKTISSKKKSTSYGVFTQHFHSVLINVPFPVSSDVMCFIVGSSGQPFGGAIPVQSNGDAYRAVSASVVGNQVEINSKCVTVNDGIGAYTFSGYLYCFKVAKKGAYGTFPNIMFSATPDRVIFGEGKFNSDVPYMQLRSSADQTMPVTRDVALYSGHGTNTSIGPYPYRNNYYTIEMSYRLGDYQFKTEKMGSYPPAPTVYYMGPV